MKKRGPPSQEGLAVDLSRRLRAWKKPQRCGSIDQSKAPVHPWSLRQIDASRQQTAARQTGATTTGLPVFAGNRNRMFR
jgi:hypothetical protein